MVTYKHFEEIARFSGWDERTEIQVLLDFIQEKGLLGELVAHTCYLADMESEQNRQIRPVHRYTR